MKKRLFFAALSMALGITYGFGQTPQTSPTPQTEIITDSVTGLPKPDSASARLPQMSVDAILVEAEKQTQNYRETFRNLLADETKTFERFNRDGEVRDQSTVESILLVYQSPKDKNLTSELRNIVKVDGKLIPDSQKRSEQFYAELEKTSTVEKELEKIQDEGSRYDKTLEISGLTVSEAVVLSNNLRPFFDFKLLGTEDYKSNQVYVVGYQQTRKSPYVLLNSKGQVSTEPGLNFKFNIPGSLKTADALLRGKLWIDAKTFQVWREERELTVQAASPVVIMQNVFDYQTSDYGILVPKQISLLVNNVKRNSDDQYDAVKDIRANFDYSRFRKSDVEVRILDDN